MEKKKATLIDLHTKEVIEEPSEVLEGADYAGHIHPTFAMVLRLQMTMLADRNKQLSAMIREWDRDKLEFEKRVQELMLELGKDYDPNKHLVVTSKEGHLWLKNR